MQGDCKRLRIAVIGSGISGLSAAWLLSTRHDVTLYERAERVGGHSNTVEVTTRNGPIPVDTGFIVYNELNYPNLTALFCALDVPTQPSDMSLAVSLDDGALEYSGSDLRGFLAQKRNLFRPRFWAMLRDLARFYRDAGADAQSLDERIGLGEYLEARRYGAAFRDDHLLPMAAAIWSAPARAMLDYPAAAFIRFNNNHGLLRVRDRPQWRTVVGGSRSYVERLTRPFAQGIRRGAAVMSVRRGGAGVELRDGAGGTDRFDEVVIATHADEALALLGDPSADEGALLGAFRYSHNIAALHSDITLMPKRRAVWSSWNALGAREAQAQPASVTYWMNRLQGFASPEPLFVTLNPSRPPRAGRLIHTESYAHPLFDAAAMRAQRRLWALQGKRRTWFCGCYFGAGFHEDGLQAGLAVAEAFGGVRRPWRVENESGRIALPPQGRPTPAVTGALVS